MIFDHKPSEQVNPSEQPLQFASLQDVDREDVEMQERFKTPSPTREKEYCSPPSENEKKPIGDQGVNPEEDALVYQDRMDAEAELLLKADEQISQSLGAPQLDRKDTLESRKFKDSDKLDNSKENKHELPFPTVKFGLTGKRSNKNDLFSGLKIREGVHSTLMSDEKSKLHHPKSPFSPFKQPLSSMVDLSNIDP